jgi:hypothetical protein
MENDKNGVKEDLAVIGLDISKTTLEGSYCKYMQEHIMQETDFDSSEDELEESDCAVIQRMLMLEMDLKDESEESDCAVIQRMLMLEMDLIFYSDDGHASSSISTANVKRLMCELCYRFHYAEYKRARVRCARLSIDKTPGQHLDCDDSNIPLLRECCIQYYSKWL